MKRKQSSKSSYKPKVKGGKGKYGNKKAKVNDEAFDWGEGNNHIASDSEVSDDEGKKAKKADIDEEDPYANETNDEKRVRLAKAYLGKLKDKFQDVDDDDDAADPSDRLASQLEKDVQESSGKLFKQVAHKLVDFEFDHESCKWLKGHKLPVTSVCATEDGSAIYSAAKDGSILKWSIGEQGVTKTKLVVPFDDEADTDASKTPTKKQQKKVPDHKKTILALAVSSDSKFVASGGVDKILRVWDGASNELLESFKGHRDAISSLAFRKKAHMLFSGSYDRTVKHWNLTEMGYVETLFGHQNEITAIDCLQKDRVVSVGRDASLRVWKIPEETQLVFHGSGSLDCLAMVSDEYYITGDDSGTTSTACCLAHIYNYFAVAGSLALWFNGKKKPTFVARAVHGGKWISSIAVLPRSDLVATGSSDGFVRLWKANLKTRVLEPVGAIPVDGFVNALAFPKAGTFLVAGVGKEHRCGRWEVNKAAANGVVLVALPTLFDE
ncbi:hypothetical protein DYB37_001605 [Aphanomyces astaci]|uniref:U3 small nucleolar RNA-interacting protein 2 n=1 Tax=Aphanomyces astaci TaxID=112090 RepID=A0A3R6ZHS8_APHAT|nr:hypothetical protein DYB26_013318 [Aphanomyces astaci]RHY80935.1 hypothetical protein DYB26_007448 [Aphanomyces astaci]RHY89882.1 hypothetical protein DYB35_000260 [Aphanomyces astaci]RHZ07930.1 hypothetical protein DYB37_001605 [Aphanomyces astaci]RQM18045.1 hypothetical protein B5M09_011817 [Aphanomyces astaci]